MRFNSYGGDGQAVLIAFALEGYDKGNYLEFGLFSYREGLPPGEYTLEADERKVRITLPSEAERKGVPGHLIGQVVRKAP